MKFNEQRTSELQNEQDDDYDTESVNREDLDTKDTSDKPKTYFTNIEVTTKKIATTIPVSTSTGVTSKNIILKLRDNSFKFTY